jgi:hypothetical protein
MDEVTWNILDILSDDWESLQQIYPLEDFPDITITEVVHKIKELLDKELIHIMSHIEFESKGIISDYEKNNYDTKYWFGLTEIGASQWEKFSEKFGGQKIDWDNFYSLSYGQGIGYIEAATREVCERVLQNEFISKGIKIVKDSINYSKVEEVKLKYYKKISDGFRIDFKYLSTINLTSGSS